MKSRIISKLFLNFSRKKPKEKSKKRIETSEHHVARIHRFFEQREDDGQIRQCGRLRIHVPVRPDLSSAYGRSGAQVHVTHPPPHPPLSHRCPSNPLLASRFSLHGEAKREQRDRVLKHRRIVSIGEEKDRIGQPCKPANRGIRTGNFVPRPPKRAFGRESRATDFRSKRRDPTSGPSRSPRFGQVVNWPGSWSNFVPLRYSNAFRDPLVPSTIDDS